MDRKEGKDAPSFANDLDGQRMPDISNSPGVIPQEPLPDRAPSREQAEAAAKGIARPPRAREVPGHGGLRSDPKDPGA